MHNPAWLLVAKTHIGVREVVGPKHNPTIIAWAKRLGAKVLGIAVNDDETPWCGTFVAACLEAVGLPTAPIAVRAKSWANYGANLRDDRLAPGAILVFERPGGGHVGFYVGEDRDHYHVLGGNQSNAVNVTRIEKSRCIARRWPRDVAVIGAPVWMDAKGQVSRNEA